MGDWRDLAAGGAHDAIVIGAGPNGLAAALTLAEAGRSVLVLEGAPTPGGGARTAELTLPGFRHDVCSAVHPLAVGSPFFRRLALDPRTEVEWIHSPVVAAHPLDDGTAVALHRSVEETALGLGADGQAWRRLFGPLAADWEALAGDLLGPLLRVPRRPLKMARFAAPALLSARRLAHVFFRRPRARALFAGLSAHSILPLEKPLTASFGLVLGMTGHALGWPLPRGGSQTIADALVGRLEARGGRVVTKARVERLAELPPSRVVLADVTPRQLVALAGDSLRGRYRRRLEQYRYGPGVFKLDLALEGPVPWRAEECHRAATVHLGGTLEEIAASESAAWEGRVAERPFVLVAQQSLFDATRAPEGRHTLWAYCHVPHGSTADMTEAILRQVERFAPGFRDRILHVSARGPAAMEAYDPNYVGGDINGGAQGFDQLFGRPSWRLDPYSTPVPGLYLCSSSTPPGGGVHGMCGFHAARSVLRGDE
ncbi:MAG TPA: NAD(P)/FAD-dependent oxidoreductase [Vicinamibacteria bacterium]|nr:NAD(P)/FAD-dependent oxidoreductase [Vicinamibacteria bacterium]